MKMGMSVQDAVNEAMSDMRDLRDPYAAHINLIAMDADGNVAGSSYRCQNILKKKPHSLFKKHSFATTGSGQHKKRKVKARFVFAGPRRCSV
jgi:hypothetical protein